MIQNPKTNLINDLRIHNSDLNSVVTEVYRLLRHCYIYYPRYAEEPDFTSEGGDLYYTDEFVELDLSGIILHDEPRMVKLFVEVNANNANRGLRIWPDYQDADGNNFISAGVNRNSVYCQQASALCTGQMDIPINSNKKLYYKLDNATWYTCQITVQGWWI